MKVPIKWLNEHVKIDDLDIKNLEERLIMSGSNTEGIKDYSENNTNIVIGKVLKQIKHPDADKLFVLQVDVATQVVQIVTGATNVNEGDFVPVALVGANLANGVKIKKGMLRGELSNGMLCSLDEFGFGKSVIPKVFDDGIYILQGEYKIGTPFFDVVDLGDCVIEFEITPNRSDCLCIEGMARETKATFERERKYIENKNDFDIGNIKEHIDVEIDDIDLCPRYAGFVIENVKIKPSPQWMQIRLMLAGVRPINNIVDVTNYVMLEIGQPIHPFDLDLVGEGKIIIRRAKDNETMVTLDSVERKMSTEDLVIATEKKAIAIAGIMGGENTEISNKTKNIFVEVANFNKTSIRLTSKKLGLRTEASSRYEKGMDPNTVGKAINRLIELYEKLEVGEIVKGVIDVYPNRTVENEIEIRTKKIKRIIGIELKVDEIENILKRLEFEVIKKEKESLLIKVPTFRLDIEKEIDLVEEIARIYGFDKLPLTVPKDDEYGELTREQNIEKIAKNLLLSNGLYELSTYSFISPTAINKINSQEDESVNRFVKLVNPLGEEYSVMRTTLLPNMIEVLVRNYNNGNKNMDAFELGNTFIPKELPIVELPDEIKLLCVASYGNNADFFILKGIVEGLLNVLGINKYKFVKNKEIKTYHPGKCAEIIIDGTKVGVVGELHPTVLENYNTEAKIVAGELNFEKIFEYTNLEKKYTPLPKYPSIERDIAILVKESVKNDEIIDIIKVNGGNNLREVKLFDIYRGKQIKSGHKSLAYNIVFRSNDKTLTDEEIQKPYDKILTALETTLEAIRR